MFAHLIVGSITAKNLKLVIEFGQDDTLAFIILNQGKDFISCYSGAFITGALNQ